MSVTVWLGRRGRCFSPAPGFLVVIACVLVSASWARAGRLPSSIVAMPGPDSTVLLVEKSSQTLALYRMASEPVPAVTMPCSTGKSAGRKAVSGDQKTPEGVYFFVDKYLEKDLSPIYGVMALPMDYPNLLDQAQGRNGSAIWMHGTDKDLKPMDSNGCVALENHRLETLSRTISLDLTPIIITETIVYDDNADRQALTTAVDGLLDRWAAALGRGTYHEFLALYAPEYCPDTAWWNAWRQTRSLPGESDGAFSVDIDQRGIYRDGEVLVTMFRLTLVRGPHRRPVGMRKLYLKETQDGLRIIGDSQRVLQADGGRHLKHDAPLLVRAAELIRDQEMKAVQARTEEEVRRMIDGWLTAWNAGDMETYGRCYADAFVSGDMDKAAWLARKSYLESVYDYVRVSISDPVLTVGKDRVHAVFRQNYQSSGYSAVGRKTLVLVNEEKTWKILQEIWKKN
ncbi:L,D-transpeptidase family protein [Desulfatiferula olefinivorans]